MRPYAGCDAWFVIRPSALRQSVATQPMHPARHPIVSGYSARAYPLPAATGRDSSACLSLATTSSGRCHFRFERFT